jgi:hypothetical protein
MKRLSVLFIILLMGLWLSSCDRNTTALQGDEAEIQELIEADYNEYFDDDVDFSDALDQYNEDNFTSPLSGLNKIATPIDPSSVLKFGRFIRRDYGNDFPRRIFVVIEDDTAFVKVSRTLGGQFVILEKLEQNGDTVSIVRHHKELYHYIEKKAVFVRRSVPDSAEARGAWKLIAISGASGKSRPFDRNTLNIKNVTLINNSTGEEFTFNDPLGKLKRIPNELPILHRGDMITMRVVVENVADTVVTLPDSSTETVQIHLGLRPKFKHVKKLARFVGKTDEGYNVYELQWTVIGLADRPHHFVVDVINNGTIYDSDETVFPYNSTTWSFPYWVK